MSTRTDLPRIKPDGQPSVFNHEMGVGAFLGNFVGAVAKVAVSERFKLPVLLGGTAIGAILGGLNGKTRQENEKANGKIAEDPGYWNKGILSGLMVGWAISTPLRYFTGKPMPLVGAVIETIGAITGSSMRRNSLQHDFDKAIAQRDKEQAELKDMLKFVANEKTAPQQTFKNTVGPEESAALAVKQASTANHVANLMETEPSASAQR